MGNAKLILLAGAAIVCLPTEVQAQSAVQGVQAATDDANAEGGGGGEEIVVTAQKRAESLQNVPISMTALTGETLERTSTQGVSDALRAVPGVAALQDRNGQGTSIAIRGVTGGFLFEGASPVAYYLDSLPFGLVRTSFSPDAGAYDLERVEVLRGPQGTLYGANALSGVVRVLTKEPDLKNSELKARGILSSTAHGGWNYRVDAAVNLPLVPEKLGVRITAGHQAYSGWIDRPNDQNANTYELTDLRVKLKAAPTDRLTLGLTALVSRGDMGAPNTGGPGRAHLSLVDEPSNTDYEVYGATLNYDFGSFSVTSSTTYLNYNSGNILDYTPFDFALGGAGFAGVTQNTTIDSKLFSEELILSSSGSGPWRWTLGSFYRHGKDHTIQIFPPFPGTTGFDDTSRSIAVFGEITRVLLNGALELTGGLRYFRDRVTTRDNAPGATSSAADTFKSTSPRAVATWHPNDDATIYASVGKGFRSGVLQTPFVAAAGVPAAKPDTLWNYEVGTKAELLDGVLSVELAGYYMEWKNIRQMDTVRLSDGRLFGASINGPSASGFGVDAALTARPVKGLSIGSTLSINSLEFDHDVVNADGLLSPKGTRPAGSPKTTLGGFLNYEFPFQSEGLIGSFGLSGSYISRLTAFGNSSGTRVVATSDPIFISRASFAVRDRSDRWGATLFVENLNNEQGVTFPVDFEVPSWYSRTRPRTAGFQFDVRF